MEKQKLAELVLQKMKEKRQLEERNRPHYQVLRLQATFAKQMNQSLKGQIEQLEAQLNQDQITYNMLQEHLQELDNTGKKQFPRIVVKPEFIASENIQTTIKQFYRKTSNSFLRADILRDKGYHQSKEREKQFLQRLASIRKLEDQIRKIVSEDTKIVNEKRTKVLKQDLRLRSIRQEQRKLRQTIQKERQDNKDLIKQYDIKKGTLQSRKDRLKYVQQQIQVYKNKIEQNFNPIAYRQHLKNVFGIQVKNQLMQKNLNIVTKKVNQIEKQTQNFQKKLQKTNSLVKLGRTTDSPSTRKGLIQNRLQQQKQRRPASTDNMIVRSISCSQQKSRERTLSQMSMPKSSKIDLDLQNMAFSSAKCSIKTTDRSSHPKYRSQLSKHLF